MSAGSSGDEPAPTVESLPSVASTLRCGYPTPGPSGRRRPELKSRGDLGRTRARAHARSGDTALITGYIGRGNRFDVAVAALAGSYAAPTERDPPALVAAVKSGRVAAEIGR